MKDENNQLNQLIDGEEYSYEKKMYSPLRLESFVPCVNGLESSVPLFAP